MQIKVLLRLFKKLTQIKISRILILFWILLTMTYIKFTIFIIINSILASQTVSVQLATKEIVNYGLDRKEIK